MLRKLGQNHQIAVPKEIVERLHLQVNDYLDIRVEGNTIVLEPQVMVPKDQKYFYTEAWAADERLATVDLRAGKVTRTRNLKELFNTLDQ